MPLKSPAWAGIQGQAGWAMGQCLTLALIGSGAVMRAHADDRPFLRTTHAMAADEDGGWEVSSTLVANRRGQALSVQIEHDVSPTQRIEVELGDASHPQAPEPERGLRLRSLWVSPADTGWGLATKLGVEPGADRADGGTRWQAMAVLSKPLWNERMWLHANAGWQWRSGADLGERRSVFTAVAAQYALPSQRWLYAEASRLSNGRDRLLHLGVRHWVVPHKLALDTGWGRQFSPERAGEFVALNLSFLDLNF